MAVELGQAKPMAVLNHVEGFLPVAAMRWAHRERSPIYACERAPRLRRLRHGIALIACSVFCLAGGEARRAEGSAPQESVPTPEGELQQPSDAHSVEQRADLYMVRKYYTEAAELYRKLTEMEPKNALYYNKLGISHHQMQNLEAAKKSYRRAIRLNPQYAQAVNNLAAVEYAEKKYRDSIFTYLRALKLTPGDAVIYSNLGTAYFAHERFDYAMESYRYALLLDPEIFRRSGRMGTIVQQRDEKNSAAFNFYMAKTYASLANVEDTLQYLRKAWEEGFPEMSKAVHDKVFEFLATEPLFQELLAQIEAAEKEAAEKRASP